MSRDFTISMHPKGWAITKPDGEVIDVIFHGNGNGDVSIDMGDKPNVLFRSVHALMVYLADYVFVEPEAWLIEGIWSGYNDRQTKVVHRRITMSKDEADAIVSLGYIVYTDGTALNLTVTRCKAYDKIEVKDGYTSLISQCVREGVNRVSDLSDVKKARATAIKA